MCAVQEHRPRTKRMALGSAEASPGMYRTRREQKYKDGLLR
jgi:hypothetical protein